MNLHENKKLFTDAVLAASEYLDIRPVYIEKDYWITRSLKLMTQNSNARKHGEIHGNQVTRVDHGGSQLPGDVINKDPWEIQKIVSEHNELLQ